MEFCCGQKNEQAIPVDEHQEISENIIYYTLNAATEEPTLPHTVEALLLTCTESTPDTERKTPLIISAQKGLTGAARLFLDRNIDKDAKDNAGRTALHHATENQREAIVRLLMEQNVNIEIQDNYGKIPLHIAVAKL
jgi:ankyrin repeat protein